MSDTIDKKEASYRAFLHLLAERFPTYKGGTIPTKEECEFSRRMFRRFNITEWREASIRQLQIATNELYRRPTS